MTLAKSFALLGALAIATAPAISHAAGLTITDDGSTISWNAHSDNFQDTMTINGANYGNNVFASGTQSSSSIFTAVFFGSNVDGGYDTAMFFTPESYYFEDAVGDIVASLTWTSDGVNNTAIFTDYAAGAGIAPMSLPGGGTAVALNTLAGIGYYGFGGTAEVTAAPEPASMALLGTGLAVVGWARRRR